MSDDPGRNDLHPLPLRSVQSWERDGEVHNNSVRRCTGKHKKNTEEEVIKSIWGPGGFSRDSYILQSTYYHARGFVSSYLHKYQLLRLHEVAHLLGFIVYPRTPRLTKLRDSPKATRHPVNEFGCAQISPMPQPGFITTTVYSNWTNIR